MAGAVTTKELHRTPDVARLLGLTGAGAWALVAVFWATYAVLVILSGARPMTTPEGWVAFGLVLAAAVVLVLPWPYPLPMWLVLALLGVDVFVNAAICWNLSPTGWPGWTSWNFGAVTFLLFMVALRGRVAWGGIGMALMVVVTVHWTWATTGDVLHGVELTYRPVATYLAGAFFAGWLQRTARQIVDFHDAERRRAHEEQELGVAVAERNAQLERIRLLAEPALTSIAAGDRSPEARIEHALLEGELRDGMRGRGLARGPLPGAVRATRLRGVVVAVLDDAGDGVSDEFAAAAAAWLAKRLPEVTSGEATIRLALRDGEPIVTLAATDQPLATYGG